jgi:hypothetical protein
MGYAANPAPSNIFPQMANWLPDDEAAQLRFEFNRELKRLAT